MRGKIISALLGKLLIGFVHLYRIGLAPLLAPCCRFHPSCSAYTMDAIRLYGPLKGSYLGLRRLLRCHPFHPGGYDPVR